MKLEEAKEIAEALRDQFAPYCEKIEIAGSIRREKAEPRDIEIVAIPKMVPQEIGMFTGVDFPDEPAPTVSALNSVLGDIGQPIKGGDRYKQFRLPQDVYLDLFLVLPPAQWGVLFTIRTGPGDFSKWLVTPKRHGGALPGHLRVHEGALWSGREPVPTPEETDFFNAIGLAWIEPRERVAGWRKAL